MSPTSHDDAVGITDSHESYPADGDFNLQLTDKEVDDALDFDLDFDAMAEAMGNALPNIDFRDMGSLGTRSPSPSESISVVSKGSKRSRADFVELDSESECDSQRDAQAKRMVFTGGSFLNRSNSGLYADQQYDDDDRMPQQSYGGDRVPSSRCQTCGLQTHRTVVTEFGFELQPLNIEGEVVNGQCILCKLLTEGETFDSPTDKSTLPKDGGRTDEEKSTSKKYDDDKNSNIAKMSPLPPPRGVNFNMGSPSPHHQQRQMMRGMHGSNTPLPPPPNRDSQRWSGKGTPTPNQYHSKMALMRQAQLPRKHSAMEHARSAVGKSNNRGKSHGRQQGSANRRSSNGVNPHNHVGGISRTPQIVDVVSSDINVEADDNYSRASQFGYREGGGKAVNMGMHCTETMSTSELHQSMPQNQHQSVSSFRSQPLHPQTPHSTSRSLSDQVPRPGSSTPQSVPVVINTMSSRTPKSVSGNRNNIMTLSGQTPTSVPANMNNSMLSVMSGGGGGTQSVSSIHDLSIMGTAPSSSRLAHSKLQSSIYHHHFFPLDDDTERAHVEKTLVYIESGSGDVCDIISAMRRFPFSPAIQRAACNKLYAHCIDQETAHAVGLVGGIRTTIDAMEHHPDDGALQLVCAGVIKYLAMASAYNLDMLDRMGTVAIITSTMERHSMNAPILEACCWAMESMARSPSSELKKSVAEGGGIQAAMKAVETFPSNESLLKAAFHCLRQLGYNPSQYNSNNQQSYPQQQQQRQQQGSSSQQQHIQSFDLPRFNGGIGGSGGMPRDGGKMIPSNTQSSPIMGNNRMMGKTKNNVMSSKPNSNQRI